MVEEEEVDVEVVLEDVVGHVLVVEEEVVAEKVVVVVQDLVGDV